MYQLTDLTDPAPVSIFTHLDIQTVLSRYITAKGIYPAVDPLDSKSKALSSCIVGIRHYSITSGLASVSQHMLLSLV